MTIRRPPLTHQEDPHDRTRSWHRRDFLAAALATTSVGLLGGLPTLAAAAQPHPLQQKVASLIQSLRRQGVLRSEEKTSWSVYDFTTRTKLISINEALPRQAASMIKPFVSQAYFYQVEQGRKGARYTDEIRARMERMIQRSTNPDTNHIMDLVSRHQSGQGPRDVEKVLKQAAPGIFQQTAIVERIPAGGQTYRNLASAHDYSRFLFAMWNNRLPYSQEMRRLMGLPSRDRMTQGVADLPSAVRVYHKTGSTAMLCGDMGIIEIPDQRGQWRAYTFIGIIERPSRTNDYSTWIRSRGDVIRRVSNLVYREMKDRHQLV